MKDGVSVIIPAYNEAGNFADAVPRYEILRVNDGSTDATHQIAQDIVHTNRHVHYVHRNTNGGLGNAFQSIYD